MLEDFFTQLAAQAPSLGILVVVVIIFLRHLNKRDEMLNGISEKCHEVQRDAINTIKENSRVLGEISVVLRKLNGR